jgi:hypothetical protein
MMGERERVGVAPGERVTVVRARNTPHVERHDYHEHWSPGLARLADWRIHWGPVIAGLLSAITAMTLLSLLGAAVGLTAFDYGDAVRATQGTADAGGAARSAARGGGVSALLSFLLGGWVASRWAGLIDRGSGAWHGALVFMLAVPVVLWLAGQGLGALLGGLGSFAGEYGRFYTPDQARAAVDANVAAADAARAAEAARRAAWGAFAGGLFGLGAAALGGYLGVHRRHEDGDRHHEAARPA